MILIYLSKGVLIIMYYFLCMAFGVLFGFRFMAIFQAKREAEDCENAYYRTPQKVFERPSENHGVIDYCCPTCKNIVNARLEKSKSPAFTEANYCDKCGQALDWGVVNVRGD